MSHRYHLIVALLAACASTPLIAQASATPAVAQQSLPAGAAADIVRDVIAVVRKDYVHPERVDAIARRLESSLASGRYATRDPAALSDRMSADLLEASGNDRHMYINFNPAEAKARARPASDRGPPDASFFRQQMIAANHGITELKILPGNVRYMNLSQWFWDPTLTPRAYDDAMRFMRDGDAMIIDIRGNGGGDADAVNYLVSHFMEPGTKLMTFREGPTQTEVTRTQRIAAGRISGKPLFVLVGPGSASASEEFASHVKHFKLGTLIGQTTAGAGNPNSLFPVAHGFVVSVSTGLAIHPVTNAGWEGEGVAPQQTVELAKALDAAHLAALKAELPSVSPQRRPLIEWAIAALSTPGGTPPSAEQMRSFAGAYEGDQRVTLRDGRLFWQRGKRAELELLPLGGSRFSVGDRFGARVEFADDGVLLFQRPGGQPERLTRVST